MIVTCFLYKGWRKHIYTPEHVYALKRMLEEHLTIPHKFVCITDQKVQCETYPLWDFPEIKVRPGDPNNWRIVGLFGMAHELGERILCLDIDMLIRRNIDSLMTDEPFKIVKGIAAPYGSCMFLFDSHKYRYVWDSFDPVESPKIIAKKRHPDGRRWIGSDQCWISHCVPDAATWTEADGVYKWKKARGGPMSEDVKVVNFGGPQKPWMMKKSPPDRWIYEEYMSYMEERPCRATQSA